MESVALKINPPSESSSLPQWDARHRRLWYGGLLVKQLERTAPGQEAVFAAFER
jgi:hypothetical protein